MASRISRLYIATGINLDKGYKNVLDYDENQMVSLVEENLLYVTENASFIRDRGVIQCDCDYQTASMGNYIAFKNTGYDEKWIFGFITKIKYISDAVTEIEYQVDVWSTWFSYWNTQNCFVAREHVNDDTVGLNTISENLDIGDTVCESYGIDPTIGDQFWVCVETDWLPNDDTSGTGGKSYSSINCINRAITGTQYVLFDASYEETLEWYLSLGLFILRTIVFDKKPDSIKNIYIIPAWFIDANQIDSHTFYVQGTSELYEHEYFTFKSATLTPKKSTYEINKLNSFSDFTPKNNKCFCFPYNYLLVSNNNGACNIFKYEDFYNQETCKFDIEGVLNNGCSIRAVPKNYRGINIANDESIPLGKFPTCSWTSDAYLNWQIYNSLSNSMAIGNMLFGMLGTASSGANTIANNQYEMANNPNTKVRSENQGVGGGVISSGLSVANGVLSMIDRENKAKMLPNMIQGTSTADVVFSSKNNRFEFRSMRSKTENLRIIDDYFTRFGYKINRLKLPNLYGRAYWNYVEIAPGEEICNPNNYNNHFMRTDDIETINKICQNGVTVWHNHSNIGNYSLDNTIVNQ